MGRAFDLINQYEEEKKKKKQTEQKTSTTSAKPKSAFELLGVKTSTKSATKKVEQKTTTTKQENKTITLDNKPNFLDKAFEAVKKGAKTAIDLVSSPPKQEGLISPVAKQDQVTKPGPTNQLDKLKGVKLKNNPANKLSLDTTTSQSSAQFKNPTAPVAVANAIDALRKQTNAGLTELSKGVVPNKDQVAPRNEYYSQEEYNKAVKKFQNRSLSDAINKDFGLGITGLIQGASGNIFKATPKANNQANTIDEKIASGVGSVLGSVWALRKIAGKFTKIANGSETIGSFLDKFPKIGKYVIPYASNILAFDVYGQIDPDQKDRLLKLAEDTATGALFSTIGGVKNGALSIPLNFAAGFALAKAQGATNEDAFISGGILSVLDASGRAGQELVKSKFKSGSMTMTPEELINQAESTNFRDTPAADVLKRAAREAQAQGKDVEVNLEVARKSKLAKAFNAQTPEGAKFSITLVDKNPIQLLKEEGGVPGNTSPPSPPKEPGAPPETLPDVIKQEFNKPKTSIRVPTEFKNPVEKKAFESVTKDEAGFIEKYKKEYQNEVSPDLVLKMLEGYKGYNVDSFSRIAGAAKEIIYNDALQTEKDKKNNTVLVTAGGPGSGKTTIVNAGDQAKNEYAIVLDTTFSNNSAPKDIKKALDNGYKVNVAFTLREPGQAWEGGAIPRVRKEGRIVSEGYFLDAHIGAQKNIISVYNKYKDNPNVNFDFYENTSEGFKKIPFDKVANFTYNKDQLSSTVKAATEKAYEQKQITKQEYEAILKDRPVVGNKANGSSEQVPQKAKVDKVTPEKKEIPTSTQPAINELVRQLGRTGEVFDIKKPVGDLWQSKGNALYITLKPYSHWNITRFRNSSFIVSAQEAGGNDVIKLVVKPSADLLKKKVLPSSKETQVVTDKVDRQRIDNSRLEGENYLNAGTRNGKKLTTDEKFMIERSVNSSRRKLGLEPYKKKVLPSSKKKVAQVEGIFKNTTGQANYDNLINNKPFEGSGNYKTIQEYMAKEKGKVGKIVQMTPDEYLAQIPQSEPSTVSMERLRTAVANGDKIDMPYLDTSSGNLAQEGRNRAYLAKEMGIKEMPVLVVEKTTPHAVSARGLISKKPDSNKQPKVNKKPSFNSREARTMQEAFRQRIYTAQTKATTQEELIKIVEPIIDKAIKNISGTELAGIRTAINKEMFSFVGLSNSHKQDYAILRTMIDENEPSIGEYLGMLEDKLNTIDEKLLGGSGPSGYASVGNYADLNNETEQVNNLNIVEFPELVKFAKELMGEVPQVGGSRRFKGGDPKMILSGFFVPTGSGKIKLNPVIFKNPSLAAKALAHEIGHLVDYFPDKSMARGNILGRIASMRKYMKSFLKETPDSEFELISPKDRAKIRRMAQKEGKNNYEVVTHEIVTGTEPTNPEEILSIWRSNTASIENPDLNAYIASLSDERKKEIVVAAMRNKIPDWVTFVKEIKKTVTEKVLKNSPADIRALYKKMLKEEILKRRLFDLETIKKELSMLSQKWKPYNPNLAPVAYNKYRNSSPELYADAISVLLNDPVLLKNDAPTFWKAFFNYIDTKPEAKQAFFDTWDLLNKGEEAVFNERQKDVEGMFQKGEEAFLAKELEKASVKTNFIYTIKLLFNNKNEPIIRRVNKYVKSGKALDSSVNPIYAYESLNYVDGRMENFIEENYEPIYKKAQEISQDGWTKLGSTLLYERSMNERGEMANPLGFNPKTAQDQLRGLEKSMTPDDYGKLKEALNLFRKSNERVLKMAEDNGFYNKELISQMKANPSYATFQVIDYLDTYISAHVYHSVGTLKEIANPATSTVMKGMSVMRAIERNNAKKTFLEFARLDPATKIEKADSSFDGKRQRFIEPKDKDLGMITVIEDGKMQAYYVEKDLANNVNGLSNDTLIKAAKIARILTGSNVYRGLFTTFNFGFQTFNFVRDFHRYWSNIPDYTLIDAITSFPRAGYRYAQAVPSAAKRALKLHDKTLKEMKDLGILGSTYSSLYDRYDPNPEDQQIDRILQRTGFLEKTKKRKIMTPIYKVLDAIRDVGDFVEALPKVAAYNELKGKNKMSQEEMADFIRTKVGSPNFRVGGHLTPITNSVFLFSNAIKEGMKSDFQVASGKAGRQSAAGFWWKTILSTLLPALITFAAGIGMFGKWYQDRINDISEYDKSNYTIIPYGVDSDGKTIALRIPRAETQRFIGGLFYKILVNANRPDLKLEDIFDVFDFGAGQLPNVTPMITGNAALLSFLSGHNPYDEFRHRNVVPDTEFKAGIDKSFPIFMDWYIKNQGTGIILPGYQDKNATDLQKILSSAGISNILGRWIKVTDYGKTEQNNRITQAQDQQAARNTLDRRQKLDAAIKEYKSGPKTKERIKAIENQLIKDTYGKPKTTGDKASATKLKKKFELELLRGSKDPLVDAVIDANNNAQKIDLIYNAKKGLGFKYQEYVKDLYKKGVISEDVYKTLKKK